MTNPTNQCSIADSFTNVDILRDTQQISGPSLVGSIIDGYVAGTMRKKKRFRQFRFQALENRMLLAADWHNDDFRQDVNGDGESTVIDALQVINAVLKYGDSSVDEMEQATVADGKDPSRRFHADVNGDGKVSSIDALNVINRMNKMSLMNPTDGKVFVHTDETGKVMSVRFEAADGRGHVVEVDSDEATVSWDGLNLTITNANNEPLVIAKPSEGILSGNFSGEDGQATVYRFTNDSEIVETYVCVPGWNPLDDTIGVPFTELTLRAPIDGFEETIGSIVREQINYNSGHVSVHVYEEMSVRVLLSVEVTLPDGVNAIVEVNESTFTQRELASEIERDLQFVLQQGARPTQPINVTQLADLMATFEQQIEGNDASDFVFTLWD